MFQRSSPFQNELIYLKTHVEYENPWDRQPPLFQQVEKAGWVRKTGENGMGEGGKEREGGESPNPEASWLQCSRSTSAIPDHGHAVTRPLMGVRGRAGKGRGSTQDRKEQGTRHLKRSAHTETDRQKPSHAPTHQIIRITTRPPVR